MTAAPSPAAPARAADWNPVAVTQAALGAWTCLWDIWAGYLGRLAAATGPAEVFEAGARLSVESLDICSRVAAERMGRLRAPLLSDA